MGRLARAATRVERYEPLVLNEQHKAILRDLALGATPSVVAENNGVSTATVNYIKHSELGQDELQRLAELADDEFVGVKTRIAALQHAALDVLEQVIGDENINKSRLPVVKLQVETAKDLLDRGGHGKVTKVEGNISHGYYTKGIDVIKERAAKFGYIDVLAEETREANGTED